MKVRADEWDGNEYRYTWTVITTNKYYVRAYLVYEDIDGTIYTVYGDEIYSASVADGVKMEN